MSDYLMETGAVLLLFWANACLFAGVTFAVWSGFWPLAVVYPMVIFLLAATVTLWNSRPSVAKNHER